MVDANVLIAAFMRDSATRRLILLGTHELHAPRYLMEEVEAHWEELSERVGLPEGPLRETLRVLRTYMSEHGLEDYANCMDKARELLGTVDPRDAPYVALALAIGANGVWSEDKDLASVPGLQVFRTADLLKEEGARSMGGGRR